MPSFWTFPVKEMYLTGFYLSFKEEERGNNFQKPLSSSLPSL